MPSDLDRAASSSRNAGKSEQGSKSFGLPDTTRREELYDIVADPYEIQ